jgi:hypothetical protein
VPDVSLSDWLKIRRYCYSPSPSPPTYIGTFDGYLTIAFGTSHSHICIGAHKGAQQSGTVGACASPADVARGALPPPRSFRRSGFLGGRLFNGESEQQITVLAFAGESG